MQKWSTLIINQQQLNSEYYKYTYYYLSALQM